MTFSSTWAKSKFAFHTLKYGFLFFAIYWLFDALIDAFYFKNTSFFSSFFSPDPMCLAMRQINLPLVILFSATYQWSVARRKRAERQREQLVVDLQRALAEVKTLTGLLPICASCKKIRNDAGSWTVLEKFIHDHSNAKFTHGICPDCAADLYPEDVKKVAAG